MLATMDYNEQKLVKKKTKYANESNYVALAETCMLLGAFYQDREEHLRALNEYKLAAKAYEKLNKPMDRAVAIRMVGEMHAALGQYKEALHNVQAYMRAAQREANTKALQEAHTTLGRVYLQRAESYQRQSKPVNAQADLTAAEKAFRTALSICDELKRVLPKNELSNMQARAHLNLGITFDTQNQRVPAKENMERAIRLAKEADLFDLLYTCYNAMALSCSRWEGTDESVECGQTLRLLNLSLEVASRLTNRASKMCQTLMLMATFFLKMDDFQSARQTLKRAYRLKTPVAVDAKRIKQKLKVLVAMCRMEDELITTEATDYARRKELYERMGDGACTLRNFSKAIDYYKLMLQNAESLGEADRHLIPCYVSLYQTYIDNRQYEQALEYLWKEHNIICNEPKEAYYTLMKIAKLYERQKKRFYDIQDVYLKAKEEAKKLQSIDLQRAPVQRAIKNLREHNMNMMADSMERDALKEGITLSDKALEPDSEDWPDANQSLDLADLEAAVEEEDEADRDTPNVGDDIDLEVDLSDDSDGDPALTIGEDLNNSSTAASSRTRKRGKRFTVRRNKKGETQLHQAVIAGNKALVEQLLQLGHPVNERDYAGWLPLHEACIHGYPEIVTLLLNRGAHINDKGGTSCEGITPLHDACRNGHLDVITVLLDRGANATQRNDFGETALSMLDGWYEKLKVPLTSSETDQYKCIRQQLVAQFDAAAISTSPPKTISQKSTTKSSTEKQALKRNPSNGSCKTSPSLPSASPQSTAVPRSTGGAVRHRNAIFDDERSESSENSTDENDRVCDSAKKRKSASAGVTEYQSVMKAMRKNLLSDDVSPKPSTSQKRRPTYRFADEDEDEEKDDWLIDDMKPVSKKSRVTGDSLSISQGSGSVRSKSSSSLTLNTPLTNRRLIGSSNNLIDSDDSDDEPFVNEIVMNRDAANADTAESAFDIIMSNSARSFRGRKSRRNSSDSRSFSSSTRRHSSSYHQSSLLDVGFERLSSPSPTEKVQEHWIPEPYQSPVKSTPDIFTPPVVAPAPVVYEYIVRVILDTNETYTVHYDETLISSTQTFGWLRNAVAVQYMMKHGKRPTIILTPAEGLYGWDDSDALQVLIKKNSPDGTILRGKVIGLEHIDVGQFYDEYSREHKLETNVSLKTCFKSWDRSTSIVLIPDFAHCFPSTPPIPPQHILNMLLLVSFFQQDWLKHLDLSINTIRDEDIATLVRYLPACRQLRVLRLQLNILTYRAVEMLCFGCTDPADTTVDMYEATVNSKALGGGLLTELDLSHNPLYDDALVPLSRLCSNLLHLRVLNVRSTEITRLPNGFNIKRLHTLDVSENSLTEPTVQYLLQQMGEGVLREAHFKSLPVYCSNFKPLLWQTLSQHRIDGLRVLNLANCRLSDDELESSLLPAIARNCPSLTHLDLSLNSGLTKRSFLAVLRSCAGAVYGLQEINFEHDVLLWIDMETHASTEELLKLIEYSPSVRYPRKIDAFLPAYGYCAERYKKLLAVIDRFWNALWPASQPLTKRLNDSLQVSLSVSATG